MSHYSHQSYIILNLIISGYRFALLMAHSRNSIRSAKFQVILSETS